MEIEKLRKNKRDDFSVKSNIDGKWHSPLEWRKYSYLSLPPLVDYGHLIDIINDIYHYGGDEGIDDRDMADFIILIGNIFGKVIVREDLTERLSYSVKHTETS